MAPQVGLQPEADKLTRNSPQGRSAIGLRSTEEWLLR